MYATIKTEYRFKQTEGEPLRCLVKHNGKYIFNPKEALKVKPDLVEEYKIKCLSYNSKEFDKAVKKMPDYECFDLSSRTLCKEV